MNGSTEGGRERGRHKVEREEKQSRRGGRERK